MVWTFRGAAHLGKDAAFPTYFHSASARTGLYKLVKSEYSTTAVE